MLEFVDHARKQPGVHLITASDASRLMESPSRQAPAETARRLAESIDVNGSYSAADQLLTLLGLTPRYVDGPARRGETTLATDEIGRAAFDRARADAAAFIEREGRLPDHVWLGSARLSLADFAATLAGDQAGQTVRLRRGRLDLEQHVTRDAAAAYDLGDPP